MSKNIFLGILFLLSTIVKAQVYNPVKWQTSVEKISDTDYNLIIKAVIESGWHLYSQNVPDEGPNPTVFTFSKTSDYQLVGNVSEDRGKTVNDVVFKMQIKFFENQAIFKQRIKVTAAQSFQVKAELEFMACNDESCLPPTYQDLVFQITPVTVAPITEVAPKNAPQIIEKASDLAPNEPKKDSVILGKKGLVAETRKLKGPLNQSDTRSVWSIFILSFLSGFAALLTPCVFPMIPMTVSFFTKQSKSKSEGIRKAIFYGFSIIAIYIFLGAIVTWAFGSDSLNALSTNVWFNVVFFILLIVFALSFLGAFEIILPSSLANKVDNQADKGGLIGILFMALALAIVSFSCTGPIVGTLLVEAASRGGIAPFIGMFGFSSALALPFALFAAFPGWLNSLPKSGGWLNTVKIVLGFLELALAFKFLSNADLVLQLHWLERETFLAIWIGIFATLALYLFGKIKLSHDSPLLNISVGRLSLGIIVLSFTVYLIPGLWGAPLKMISGFPPPINYSEIPNGLGGDSDSSESKEALPKDSEYGPHNIIAFTDYAKGMTYAKKIGKPVMLDFTGHACVNCRKMEDNVWSDKQVQKILKGDLILISLYVDDKRELPENERVISRLTGKKIKYIGQKWSEFQTITYKTNAQPFYVLINNAGKTLSDPMAYNPDITEYLVWLKSGISNFKKK